MGNLSHQSSFSRKPEVIEAEVSRILEELPTDTLRDDLASYETELKRNQKLYEKIYGKHRAALAGEDDMLAERLEADCKTVSEEIKAYEGVADQLRAKLAAKERIKETRGSSRTTAASWIARSRR